MSRIARSLTKKWLLRQGVVLSRPPGQFDVHLHKLRLLRDRGLRVRFAVDGGAAVGGWTRMFKSVYPESEVLCVEPRGGVQPKLEALASELPGVHIAQTLLGDKEDSVEFCEQGAQSSMLRNSRGERFGHCKKTSLTTLDRLVARMQLGHPDLIKLDLQGAELICLNGAKCCLQHAEVVVLEVSFMPFMKGMSLIGDVIPYMSARGYRCYDILALWHRPLDGALAQGDLVFVRENSALVADNRWSVDAQWS